MLRSLLIRNYVLIDSLEVGFPEGLVIITGQTGAGKSILLGALSLALGARSDASVIKEGADSCVVEAEFSVSDPQVDELLSEHDVETDGGRLLVRRVVSASGRSRSFINDCPVPVQLLQSLSERLVDVHSQHQGLSLSDKAFQMAVLDRYAGNPELLDDCRKTWKELQDLRAKAESARSRLARLEEDREYNESRFSTLDKANLRDGELAELEQVQKQLAGAEQILASIGEVRSLLDPPDGESMAASLKEASRVLEKTSRLVPSLSQLASRLDSARIELEDILSEVEAAGESVSLSPERLEEVESRMSLIYDLFNRFSCRSEAELIARREEYSRALFDSSALEEELAGIESSIKECTARHAGLCRSLAASRRKAAPALAAEIESSLHFLELESAVFSIALAEAPAGPSGSDAVSFLFSATGSSPADVSRCASGGEISRIMLCLKAVMARYASMPTMVFDEIDTGVSGSAADKMGQMICRMGRDMQVFAITHLPQVAAQGDAHYLVSRENGRSGIRLLEGGQRVGEIARLLSGSSVTAEAVANAEALLRAASRK